MIEKTVIDYLNSFTPDETPDIPCYAERPEEEPGGKYLVVEKTGSTEENHITDATIAISSYADTMYEASELNEAVKYVMRRITMLPNVSAVRLNSDYNFTSTAAKCYRYQAVFILTYYEEEQDV